MLTKFLIALAIFLIVAAILASTTVGHPIWIALAAGIVAFIFAPEHVRR